MDLKGVNLGTNLFKKRHKLDMKNVSFHNREAKRIFFDS